MFQDAELCDANVISNRSCHEIQWGGREIVVVKLPWRSEAGDYAGVEKGFGKVCWGRSASLSSLFQTARMSSKEKIRG